MKATPQSPAGDAAPGHAGVGGGLIAYMAENSVAANILMLIVVLGGLLTLPSIKQEVFPEFTLDRVTISVAYPGASPTEVEEGAVLAIEEAVRGVDGVKKVTSTSAEGSGSVMVELQADADVQRATGDIESAVDRITSFAADVERPIISVASNRREVLSLILYGPLSEWDLRDLAERLRDQLLSTPKVTLVELRGVRPYEISVEIPQEILRRYDLTLEGVAAKIRGASIELPGGGLKTGRGEILVRTAERRDTGAELADVVLRENAGGGELRLGDVADIRDGFQDTDQAGYFDGQPAIQLQVFRVGEQTPIEVSAAVHDFIEAARPGLPEGVKLATWNDSSEAYAGRVDLLVRNAKTGLILVLGILGVFLDLRLAFWITLGIPISFCGALLLMPWLDVSLNLVSLFAFILTLGIVVDDAIVVGEAIYHEREQGGAGLPSAVRGTQGVATPVTFSIVTTIIAFLPLLFVPDVMGKIMRVLPLVVMAILAFSLFESMLVLPAHLAHTDLSPPGGLLGYVHAGQQWVAGWLQTFIDKVYSPFLTWVLRGRYVTAAVAVAVLMGAIGLVKGRHVEFIFMPRIDSDVVVADLTLPFGANVEDTRALALRLAKAADETLADYGGREAIGRGVLTLVGSADRSGHGRGSGSSSGSHMAQVSVFLVSEEHRDFGSRDFARTWREKLGPLTGIDTLKFKSTNGPSGGADVHIELIHADTEVLEAAAAELAAHLGEFSGVTDIDDGVASGKEQLNLKLTRQGRAWGFAERDLARAVRAAFFGHEALRLQRGRHEVRTYVRLPEAERANEADLAGFLLLTESGREIPLGEAATFTRGRAPKEILRRDGRRVMNVTAEVDDTVTNAGRVTEELLTGYLPELLSRYPGLTFQLSGAQESRRESMAAMARGFRLALVAMYALMAIAFRSYSQPLLIMLTIPFGIVGAMAGHMLRGMALSLMSMFGVVALAGVVVNDSLVLISAMNENLEDGKTPFEAVHEGATRRFRPILLTSLTTYLGLIPMLNETSLQARFLIPMAVSLGVGVLFATWITLVLIPAAYLLLEDARWLVGELLTFGGGDTRGKEATP